MLLPRGEAQRRQLVLETLPLRRAERRAHADRPELTSVEVQAEEQRADADAALVPPESGHDAVGGSLVLDLEHHALVGHVADLRRLRDDPVGARALERAEPLLRLLERVR